MTRRRRSENRQWTDRRTLATVVRVAVLGGPLLVAVLVVQALHSFVLVHLSWPFAASLLVMAVTAFAAGALTERATRRLLPLPGLLRMSMLFPDRAPSRLKVAKLGSSNKQLERMLVDGRAQGCDAGEVVLGLVTALTQHDRRTRGHSERVRMYADLLANEMGLASQDRDRLRWAALLHDVGKLKIAPKVLNKPVALTEDEWQRMRMHPLWGAELAEPLMPWLGEWGRGIAEHHEKFDGRGYPRGLSGEEISQAGRMVAVIDAFETMTAARPYKQPMATAAARAELARCAGTHFDPVVVRAFLGVSLPRLLWAMGPLALVVHLPFLRELQLAGSHIGASASATATSASIVAASTALAVTAVVVPSSGTLAEAVPTATVQEKQVVPAGPVRDAAPAVPGRDGVPAPEQALEGGQPEPGVTAAEPPPPTATASTTASPVLEIATPAGPAAERPVGPAAVASGPPAQEPAAAESPAPKPPAPKPAAAPPAPTATAEPPPAPPAPRATAEPPPAPAPEPPAPSGDDDDDDDDERKGKDKGKGKGKGKG